MRSLLLFAFAASPALTLAQDLVRWGDVITWKDFKGPVPERIEHDAYTAYRIMAEYRIADDGTMQWVVDLVFDRQHSWVVPSARKNADLLEHERLHFDIAEVHARELRSKVIDIPRDDKVQRNLKAVLDTAIARAGREQDLYDRETSHGRDEAIQSGWSKQVNARLTELDAWRRER